MKNFITKHIPSPIKNLIRGGYQYWSFCAEIKKRYGDTVKVGKPIAFDFDHISMEKNAHILDHVRMWNVSGDDRVRITIGENTGIGYRCTVLAGADVSIGNNVAIASDVFITSGSHGIDAESDICYGCQPYVGKAVVIGDNAWLGEKVCVMQGVSVGKYSIVGAGAIVTKSIPDYCIAVGNPAKVIKKYNFESHSWEKV